MRRTWADCLRASAAPSFLNVAGHRFRRWKNPRHKMSNLLPSSRPTGHRAGTFTMALLAVNVAVFIFQNAAEQLNLFPVYGQFALSLNGLKSGHLWQLLTFQFLHLRLINGGVFHLLGNLFLIHVFGSAVEQALGGRKFLGLYLLSGTAG